MFQKQQVVTHPVRRILILLLALLLVCGTPTWANAESSSDLQSIVQTGDTVQIEATNATAKNELNELEETGGAVLFSTEASQMAAKDNVELTYTRKIQYEGYFTRNFRVKVDGKTKVAYCVQPKETPPPEGNHTAEDYNNKLMTKALYYSYGYAGYDKHTKQYVSKRDDDDDWTDDDGAYALCHMILSYLYDKSSADSDAFNGVSSDTIKLVKHNHKTSDTTVTNNQITGITEHHPRNVMLISKFDNTREFIAVTWKGQIIRWTTNLGICITF